MRADKGQFDSVLSQMLRTPPKKESEIKSPKTRPSRRQSDRQNEEVQPDKDGEPSV